jgi:hypothetical protein
MKALLDCIRIRRFEARDAEICSKIRSEAFIQKFYGELSPRETSAGVNAFMPNDSAFRRGGVYPRPNQCRQWFAGGDKPRPYEIKMSIILKMAHNVLTIISGTQS